MIDVLVSIFVSVIYRQFSSPSVRYITGQVVNLCLMRIVQHTHTHTLVLTQKFTKSQLPSGKVASLCVRNQALSIKRITYLYIVTWNKGTLAMLTLFTPL